MFTPVIEVETALPPHVTTRELVAAITAFVAWLNLYFLLLAFVVSVPPKAMITSVSLLAAAPQTDLTGKSAEATQCVLLCVKI